MGSYAALAAESYRFPHTALFSTELLRDYFRRHAHRRLRGRGGRGRRRLGGVRERDHGDRPAGRRASSPGRRPRRLLFYARPEPHAARNMFELGVLALSRALERGAFADGWSCTASARSGPAGGSTSAAAR